MNNSVTLLGSFRPAKVSLRVGAVAVLALMLSACAVRSLEDVMGPGTKAPQTVAPALANAAPAATAPPSVADPKIAIANLKVESPSNDEENVGTPVLPSDVASPQLLAAAEDQSKFTTLFPWRAILGAGGIDATNAEGATCSGRYASDRASLTTKQRFLLACSDGETAELQILSLQPNAMQGSIKIGKSQFGVALEKSTLPAG